MSTVDPAVQRAIRESARRQSGSAMTTHIVVMVLVAVAAGVIGFGIVSELDGSTRIEAINGIQAQFDRDRNDPFLAGGLVAIMAGGPALVMLILGSYVTARAVSGRELGYPGFGPVPVAMAGLTAGVLLAVPGITRADHIGYRLLAPYDLGNSTDAEVQQPWSGSDWFWYRLDIWGPLLAVALTVMTVVLSLLAQARKRRRIRALKEVLAQGVIVPGKVTDAPIMGVETVRTLASVTVKFADPAGTDRWVTQTAGFHRSTVPVLGQAAAVLLDPTRPGDTDRIWAAPAGSSTADEFLRWRLRA